MWSHPIDMSILSLQSKPFSDKEDLLPVCFLCSALTNPLINNTSGGDAFVHCAHNFERSFLNIDQLPLVDFAPGEDITDEEAERLDQREDACLMKKRGRRAGGDD